MKWSKSNDKNPITPNVGFQTGKFAQEVTGCDLTRANNANALDLKNGMLKTLMNALCVPAVANFIQAISHWQRVRNEMFLLLSGRSQSDNERKAGPIIDLHIALKFVISAPEFLLLLRATR